MDKAELAATSADQLVHIKSRQGHSGVIMILGMVLICLPIVLYLLLYHFASGLQPRPSILTLDWIFLVIIGLGVVSLLVGFSIYIFNSFAYSAQKRKIEEALKDSVVDSLINRIQRQNSNEYKAIITILGDLRNRNAVPTLTSALKSKKDDIRKKAVQALGKMQDEKAMEALSAALKDIDEAVRTNAAGALDKLKWEPGNDTEKAYYYIAYGFWGKVKKLGEPGIEPVINVIRDKNSAIRKEAVKTLGKIGDDRAIDPLTEALKDPDQVVRDSAKAALNSIRKKL